MADEGRVQIKVATDVEMSEVEALDKRLAQIKKEKIQLEIDAKTAKLEETRKKIDTIKKTIDGLEAVPPHLGITIDDGEIEALKTELASLEHKAAKLELDVEKGELDAAKDEVEQLDGKEISLQLATANLMAGLQTIKQGVGELKQNMDEVLGSAGRMEQTETFLSMNLGADVAKKKLEEIRSVTDSLPGDDVTLQNLLSQATLKDADMTTQAYTQMGSAAADYMAAMQNFGKTSTETQQDLMNYILAGNTAEIERSPILQAHVDKLKEGTTVQERAKLLQEALTKEGWAGIASQDIYNNKQQQFADMLERGKMGLGDMFLKGSEGAMDYIMQLDKATNGVVGIGIAAGQMAGGPMFSMITGLGQVATAYNTLKEVKVVQTVVDWALAAAEWAAASPLLILAVLIAAVIAVMIALYMNSEQVRNTIDGLGQTFMQVGQIIWGAMVNAVNQVIGALGQLWNYIMTLGGFLPEQVSITGNSIIDGIMAVMFFIATLPMQLGVIFTNMIAKALGFGDNFVQRMYQTAINSATRFINQIRQLPGKLAIELQQMLSTVGRWAATLPQKFWDAGVNAVRSFLSALGIASPGTMQRTLAWEITEMGENIPEQSQTLLRNINTLGSDVVDEFGDPTLNMGYNLDSNNTSGNGAIGTGQTININLEVGTVDNEDRVNEIVEAVRKALSWENTTAGRSV